jgi:hypothetical protein
VTAAPAIAVLAAFTLAGCGDEPKYTIERLQDPETCKECHPKHYQQWSGSMHAYASEDPVFVALNARGQRETGGELGDFCLRCHAPMALELGEATGVTYDPDALSPRAKGITCYFCHNVDRVIADHNNGLVLAMDQTMRGGARNPVDNPAHHSAYDPLMASRTNNSTMCGSCHDIVTANGVHLERTFAEWKDTVFAFDDPQNFLPLTCSGCHMFPSTEVIADAPGLTVRSRTLGFHEHMWPAVDQALTPFPEMEAQAAAIQRDLDPALKVVGPLPRGSRESYGGVCLDPPGILSVRVDSFNVGHMFPSGAAQDRRAWLEVIAYRADDSVVFSSGVVPDGMDPEDIADPYLDCASGFVNCGGFWDRMYKADNTPAHFFWDVTRVESHLIRPAITNDENSPDYDHSTTVQYTIGAAHIEIDRIEVRMRMRALPYALLDTLIASGDLDPSIRGQLKTLELASTRSTWLRSTAGTGAAQFTNCNPK